MRRMFFEWFKSFRVCAAGFQTVVCRKKAPKIVNEPTSACALQKILKKYSSRETISLNSAFFSDEEYYVVLTIG
jgi:hypothetical protein